MYLDSISINGIENSSGASRKGSNPFSRTPFASLAQLVEHLLCIDASHKIKQLKVLGSTPKGGKYTFFGISNIKKCLFNDRYDRLLKGA